MRSLFRSRVSFVTLERFSTNATVWDETDAGERPRAGLAVPLQGTGESIILATSRGRGRGRPVSRSTRDGTETDGTFPVTHGDVRHTSKGQIVLPSPSIELVNMQRAGHISEISDYQLSRSNSAAPADAKLPVASDPFADDIDNSMSATTSLQFKDHHGTQKMTNKHLDLIKPSRPLVAQVGRSPVPLGKNRFKSRSTSSSNHDGSRRTQSAHTPSNRHDKPQFSAEKRSILHNDTVDKVGSRSLGTDVDSEVEDDAAAASMTMSASSIRNH